VLREQGEREGSEERLVACLALCEEAGDRHVGAATQLALGSLRADRSREEGGGGEGGRELLVAARDAAQANGFSGVAVLARCELALLPDGDAQNAVAAYTEHEERLKAEQRREARLLLFRATGDRAHLEEARRLLDEALSKVPEHYHESMCQNLRVNREILAAWPGESEEKPDDDDEPGGTESITRAGL